MLQQTAWCPSPTCPSRNCVWGDLWFCSPRGGIQSLKKSSLDVQAGEVGGLSQVNHSRTNSCGDIVVARRTWAKINGQFAGLFGLSPPNPTGTPKTTGGQALLAAQDRKWESVPSDHIKNTCTLVSLSSLQCLIWMCSGWGSEGEGKELGAERRRIYYHGLKAGLGGCSGGRVIFFGFPLISFFYPL